MRNTLQTASGWCVLALACAALAGCGAAPIDDADREKVEQDVRELVDTHAHLLSPAAEQSVLSEGWTSCAFDNPSDNAQSEEIKSFGYRVEIRPQPEVLDNEQYLRDLARSNLEQSGFAELNTQALNTESLDAGDADRPIWQPFAKDGYRINITVLEAVNVVILEGSTGCLVTAEDLPVPLI